MREWIMARLIVRDIDERIVAALRLRAARNGRSVEAEHSELLRAALLTASERPSFKDFLRSMPEVHLPERRKEKSRRVTL